MKEKKVNIKKRRNKPRFAVIYGIILFIATVTLMGHVLYHLWWSPRMETGVPILGYRMSDLSEIDESWLTETEEFGGNQEYVDYVELLWAKGPVIYFNVRVEEETSLRNARLAATEIVEHFIEISDEVALDYNLQVVVSYGDIAQRKEENQAAVTAHVHEYYWSLTEAILAHAEAYPSSANVDRAERNINAFANSILLSAGEDELDSMRARHAAIKVMTVDQEAESVAEHGFIPVYVADHSGDVRRVPPSEISEFPNWGVWNNQRSRIDWN
jgi:hypothetical protein